MEELEVAIEAVKKTGAIVKEYHRKVDASCKSDKSLTTMHAFCDFANVFLNCW